MGLARALAARLTALPPALLLALLTAAQLAVALALPPSHDEDQYLAASVLVGQGARLYRDFLYVQTPLQPCATGWLAQAAAGHVFLTLRLLSVALGALTLAATWAAQRRLGVGRERAAIAVTLMASTYVFQFSFGVFRNDALPTALLVAGLLCAAGALRSGAAALLGWAACGLALGLAAGAKASFALPLVGAGAWLAVRWLLAGERQRLGEGLAFAAGAAAGLAPLALAWAGDPEAVRYALVGYWAEGPQHWYAMNGMAARLGLGAKLADAAGILALGPAGAVLAIVAAHGRRPRTPAQAFLDVMIVAGIVAALAPSPTYRQYFAPLLPPLFVRLGLTGRDGRWGRGAAIALAVFGVVGAGGAAWLVARAAATRTWAPPQVAAEAAWVGAQLRAARVQGAIVTLSPRMMLDSGPPLDHRFAGGALIYRSADAIAPALRARLHLTSPASLAADLDAAPPAAILTGFEDGSGDFRVALDARLRDYARRRGYAFARRPAGQAELFVRLRTVRP